MRPFCASARTLAQHLGAARQEAAARRFRFRVRPASPDASRVSLDDLPSTLTWRRAAAAGPGRFEILYDDGADLMWQLAEFFVAAGVNREEFFYGMEHAAE